MRAVFIGGCDRSGTTFLGAQLARFEGVLALPESPFLSEEALRALDGESDVAAAAARIAAHFRYQAWREAGCAEPSAHVAASASVRALIDNLVLGYAHARGFEFGAHEPVFVEHSPSNTRLPARLTAVFPDLNYLHIVRDGRAVAASLLPLDWGPTNIVQMAGFWRRTVEEGFDAAAAFGPARAMTVSFETLVEGPAALEDVAGFLGLGDRTLREATTYAPPDYAKDTHRLVGAAPSASRLEGWRDTLSPRAVALFELGAGDTLDSLGYQCICDRQAIRPASVFEKGAMRLADMYKRRRNLARFRRRHEQ